MNTLGLIGFPVAHSKSPEIFRHFFEESNIQNHWEYKLFPLESIDLLPVLLQNEKKLRGFNVTIPFKQDILAYLQFQDISVIESGAANTVIVERQDQDFRLKGYNTDVLGFRKAILECVNPANKKALILGTGGSSKAVKTVLAGLNIPYLQVSRTPKEGIIDYAQLNKEIIEDHSIIINTTPLGMAPNTETYPNIPYHFINHNHHCIDLVYNPAKTLFMKKCIENQAAAFNGLSMLQFQAEAAWDLFSKNGI